MRWSWFAFVLALGGCGEAPDGSDGGADAALDVGTDAFVGDAGRLPGPRFLPERSDPPDPFVSFFDGRTIVDAEGWRTSRRPELLELFQHYVYGFVPPTEAVSAEQVADELLFEGAVRYEAFELRYGPAEAPPIELALFRPAAAAEPVPVLLALNKCGTQSLDPDPSLRVSRAWMDPVCLDEADMPLRGARSESWPIEAIVARGYALATFHESDADPDDRSDTDFADGIQPHLPVDAPPEARWGAIGAWAYGLSRAVDHLETLATVDASRIATVGHSRRGKAALWAAALDERIAMAIPHQSGTGGATLSRSSLGESVRIINLAFPHWFDEVFAGFADQETRLPIDQHLLLAMVAPRAVLVTNGDEDSWADPPGALRAVELADPVWALLEGSPALVVDDAGRPTLEGKLSWHSRPGDHSLRAEDWTTFMDFADRHL